MDHFSEHITIFLSATIDNIKKYIREDLLNKDYLRHSNCYSFYTSSFGRHHVYEESKVHEYSLEKNYSYINPKIIQKRKQIADIVHDKGGKWLIFVDNIEHGKKLKKEIKSVLPKEEQVVMITADYEKSNEGVNEVASIVQSNRQSAKVLITTSVMDNGITLKDVKLRKIMVLADTEEEFVQMLGRKREDGDVVDVYIYKYSREHFQRRLNMAKYIRNIADGYIKDIKPKIEQELFIRIDGNIAMEYENKLIGEKHRQILQDIFEHKISYDAVGRIFNVYNGMLYLNKLSVAQNENLNNYYLDILEQFDKDDEYAFVRRQLSWLDYGEEEINNIISEQTKDYEEMCREKVMDEFRKIAREIKTRDEIMEFKNFIKDYLIVLVEDIDDTTEGKKTLIDSLKRTTSSLSKNNLEFLREHCEIPFELKIDGKNYKIIEVENKK